MLCTHPQVIPGYTHIRLKKNGVHPKKNADPSCRSAEVPCEAGLFWSIPVRASHTTVDSPVLNAVFTKFSRPQPRRRPLPPDRVPIPATNVRPLNPPNVSLLRGLVARTPQRVVQSHPGQVRGACSFVMIAGPNASGGAATGQGQRKARRKADLVVAIACRIRNGTAVNARQGGAAWAGSEPHAPCTVTKGGSSAQDDARRFNSLTAKW